MHSIIKQKAPDYKLAFVNDTEILLGMEANL
jgi:hypothetical protein